ncbi:MAG: GNAT family N-acetyltransferase [Myxococcota bacterium]|nr:GNAT family N-acetyltransferase [Myxococcota bacterium]
MEAASSQTVLIRLARPEDSLEIADVHVRSWQKVYRGIMPDPFLDNLSAVKRGERWKQLLSQEHQIHVACINGVVVGFSSTRNNQEDSDTAELSAIYIHPEHWGKGLGKALFKSSCEALRALGVERLMLWVATDNSQARNFYSYLGMTVDGITKRETFGGIEVEAIRYWFDL